MKSTVVVVSTGGTIAMRPEAGTGKLVPLVSGDELVEMIGWTEAPPVELDDLVRVPSFAVHGELALSLARQVVRQAERPEVRGVVVTHGTDTMEESVYLIDRLLGSGTPVVLTGAQRGADEPDADGPWNLRDAIRVATSAVNAFDSPGYGAIGHVDVDVVSVRRQPVRAPTLPVPERLAFVDLHRLFAGSDGRFVRHSLETGAEAIVLQLALGAGLDARATLAAECS